jgi:hypothetical protein
VEDTVTLTEGYVTFDLEELLPQRVMEDTRIMDDAHNPRCKVVAGTAPRAVIVNSIGVIARLDQLYVSSVYSPTPSRRQIGESKLVQHRIESDITFRPHIF